MSECFYATSLLASTEKNFSDLALSPHMSVNFLSLVPLRKLQKPDDVPICVFDPCNQLPPTDICDRIDDCSDTLIHEELILLAEHPGFDRDVAAHPALPRELVSLSHRVGFARHYYDETKRGKVTDGRSGTPRYKRYKRYK